MPPEEWDEAGKWTSAAQAVFLLAGFFAAVVFAGDLNFRPPLIVSAPPVWLVSPPPPAQVVKKEETPAPVSEPEPAPKTESLADIALKKEEERKKREERERKERERKEREEEERQLAEKKRKEEEERKKREEEERKERERIAEQREEEERQRAEESAEAAARAEILGRLKDNYIGRIIGRIKTPTPLSAQGIPDLEVVVEVRLHADGELDGLPVVVEMSGVPDYDEAAVRAVLNAAPLPMPKEPELLEEFRILTLRITPKE